LVLTIAVLGNRRAMPQEVRFQNWMQKYNKQYVAQDEYQTRLANFIASTKIVNDLNAQSQALGSDAVFELNKFADRSAAERASLFGLTKDYVPTFQGGEFEPLTDVAAPPSFDWRTKNKLTPVKDQGQCGSCWAFSCTESIESVYMISKGINGDLAPLAPQQIVDCDKVDGGCNGGDLPTCYRYVIGAGGLEKNSDYPYHAKDQSCQDDKSKVSVKISNFKFVIPQGSKDENSMANYVATSSPVSIIVDAEPWQFYKSGVMTASQCGLSLDHAVQIVGYDTDAGYWIVRNSWGGDWGEKGHIRLQFGKNTCGLTSEVTVPTL